MRRLVVVPAALVAMFGGSCAEATKPDGGSNSPFPVSLTASPPGEVRPGGAFTVTVSATAPANDPITVVGIHLSGVVNRSDSVAVPNGWASWDFAVSSVPIAGVLHVTGFARTRGGVRGTATRDFQVVDQVPPVLTVQGVDPAPAATVEPGVPLHARFTAIDEASIRYVLLRVTGAVTLTDSVAFPPTPATRVVGRDVSVFLPPSSTGRTVALTAVASDHGGHVTTVPLGTFNIRDQQAPAVNGGVSGQTLGATFQGADTIRLQVLATENVALRYVGFALDGPITQRDSVFTTGGSYSRIVTVPVSGRVGTSTFRVFAADSAGNRVDRPITRLVLGARTQPAVRYVTLADSDAVTDVAYDEIRDRLYLTQPRANQIAVVARLATSELAPIAVAGRPNGVDLSRRGDSLLVALLGGPWIGVVDLVSGAQSRVTVDVARQASSLRVAANGHVIVAMTDTAFTGAGIGQVLDFDLTSGRRGGSPFLSETIRLVRSADRRRVFGIFENECCPINGIAYDATLGGFGAIQGTADRFSLPIGTNADGTRLFVDTLMFTSDVRPVGPLRLPRLTTAVTAGSDPSAVFIGWDLGVARVTVPDGTLLDRVALPFVPQRILLLPDELTLVAVRGNRVAIIDWW